MDSKLHSKQTKQSGMVLVLAILVMGVVLGTAIVFSNLIIREIQQSRLIDQSIQAYYLAESGSERALYQLRQREAVIDCDLVQTGSTCLVTSYCSAPVPANTVPCINDSEGGLNINGSWQLTATNEQETTILLKRGESFQIDLFDPFQSSESNINEVGVYSADSGLTLYGEFVNLTNILNVTNPTVAICLTQPPVFKDFIEEPPSQFGSLDGKNILDECSYSFRLNFPFNSPQESSLITFTVYDRVFINPNWESQLVPIPSRLLIDSEAAFGSSFQRIRVRTPIRPPLSGLYDFVLFSEQEIKKIQP